jgi:uncharacterized Zn-binding protein involved in type VI secretion
VPLDNPAVTKALTLGTRTAARVARQHHATDVWTRSREGSGHQGTADSTNVLEGVEGGWSSTPLANVPGALEMQAGDLKNAVAQIGKAQGALATTGAVFGALTAAEQTVSTLVSAIPFPAFPAVRVADYDVGLPHAHNHPPNLVPPAPPVPLPSTGPVIPIPYVSGASTVLINGMPAGRCGDVGMGIWCGGFFPMFEIFLGSSSVWIEGMRAARLGVDITKHCIFSTPKPEDPPMGPPFGMTVTASPNVLIGGVPMPSLTAMAVGAALKVAFKGLSKLIGALKESGIFSRAATAAEDAAERKMPQTGAGGMSAEEYMRAQQRAEAAYDRIRADTGDVAEIAKNTNMPTEDIQAIKNHVFHEEHLLDRYVDYGVPAERARFDPDPRIADAWDRLRGGQHIRPEDMQLLQHELAESRYMKEHGPGYNAAHDHAQQVAPSPYEGTPEE